MYLKVEKIFNARRMVGSDEASERHWQELKAYLVEEVHPKGFKFERNGNEVAVIGYCGEFQED